MARFLTFAAVVLLVAVTGGFALNRWSAGEPVEASRARLGEIREFVDELGKTRLPDTYIISMPYNGRAEAIELIEGTAVKRGQVVAQISRRDVKLALDAATTAVARLEASIRENADLSIESTGLRQVVNYVESMNRVVEAAAAQVATGKAKLDYADKNLTRMQRLYDTKAVSEDDVDRARVQQVTDSVTYQQDVLILRAIEALQAATALAPTTVQQYIERKGLSLAVVEKQKAEAEVTLARAQWEQEQGTMTSPVDGVILQRLVTNEGYLAAGTPLLHIGRLQDLEVEADILSQDALHVKPGEEVEIQLPTSGEAPARGSVERVYPAGFTKVSSLGVEQQRVKVVVKFNPDGLQRLRDERGLGVDYRVRVRIFTADRSNTLVVPRSALFRGLAGNWQVFAVRDGAATLQSVKTGLMNDEQVEVIEGLSDQDVVILAPETNLADGTRVAPIFREGR